MTVSKRAVLAVGLVVCMGGAWWATSRAEVAPQKQASPPAPAALAGGYMGTASCSARACHGGDEPVKNETAVALQNEYTHVVMYDKHAQAYSALLSPRAKKIAENLAAGGKPIDADKDGRCLACHATPESAWGLKPDTTIAVETVNWHKGGVSCEACHGPANKPDKPWFAVHTSSRDWREPFSKSPKRKAEYGFTDLTDPAGLARTCTGCHVGAPADPAKKIPARDCNHDIMAAGHPRLNFELSSFVANMPPHWNVKLKGESAEKDAKMWLAGRTVSAKAALDLLADRAGKAKQNKTPWPELAEYRCYSCHTDLSNNWAKFRNEGSRPRGTLPYDTWYSSLLPLADPSLADGYKKLTLSMTHPEPGDVAEQAKQMSKALDGLLAKDATQVLKDVLAEVKKLKPEDLPRTWEDATQLSLALAARDRTNTARIKELKPVLDALMFPPRSEGPSGVDGPAADKKSFDDMLKLLLAP